MESFPVVSHSYGISNKFDLSYLPAGYLPNSFPYDAVQIARSCIYSEISLERETGYFNSRQKNALQ